MQWLEAFINWQNDLTWGPFEALRPPKTVNINARLCGLVCICGIAATVVASLLAVLACWLVLYDLRFHQLPPLSAAAALLAYLIKHVWWLFLAAGGLFLLLFLPYLLCWNRRAAFLRRQSALPEPVATDGVWPPPPRRG